jgi:hypothetical protein
MVLYLAMPMLGGLSGLWLMLTLFDHLALATVVGLIGGMAVGLGLWLLVPAQGSERPWLGDDHDGPSGEPPDPRR